MKSQIFLKGHWFHFSVILLIVVFSSRNYIININDPITGIDSLIWIGSSEYFSKNLKFLYIWINYSFGNVGALSYMYILLAFINSFIHNSILTVKFFIIFSQILAAFAMYLLLYNITKDKTASLVSSIFYILNPFFVGVIGSGHLNTMFAYTLTPLLFLYVYLYMLKGDVKYALYSSLIVSMILISRFDNILYILPLFAFYISFYDKKNVFKIFKVLVLLLLLAFLVLGYIFIPLLFDVKPQFFVYRQLSYERLLWYSSELYETIVAVPTHSFIPIISNIHFPPDPPHYNIYFLYILVIIIFLSILLKRDKITLFFYVLALISVFLAKGSREPFGELYLKLWIDMPYFSVFSVPSRWLIITCFSYSILLGISIKEIKYRLQIDNRANGLFSLLFIILILLSNTFIINYGYMTYKFPKDEVIAYKYISNISSSTDNFRVLPIPFNREAIKTEKWGLMKDLGFESHMLHGKEVVRTGEGMKYSKDFITFLDFMMFKNATNTLMKVFGIGSIKYIVDTGKPLTFLSYGMPYYQHNFIKSQKFLNIIYNKRNITIYENKYFIPKIFVIQYSLLSFEGRETLIDLAELSYYHFNHSAIYFVDQIIRESGKQTFYNLYNLSNSILISNSELTDLTMLLINDSESIRIIPSRYAYPSINTKKYWISSDYAIKRGLFVYSSRTLHTEGENTVEIPFDIKENNYYEVWIRVLYGKNKGKLIIKINNTTKEFIPYNDFETFKWIKIGEIYLNEGKHELIIQNKKSKYGVSNDMDEIVIVKKGYVEKHLRKAEKLIEEFNGSILMFFDSEQIILKDVANEKTIIDEKLLPFWRISDEKSTKYGFAKDSPKGYSYSLMLNLNGERKYYTIIDYIFNEMQDWNNYTGFYIWFKGQGTGKPFFVDIYFNKSYNNWVRYTFVDDAKEWRKIVFFKSDFKSKKGKIDWSKVWRIGIGSDDKGLTGEYYIGTLNAFIGEKRVLEINIPRTDDYRMSIQLEGSEKINILAVNNKTIKIFADKEWIESEIFRLKKGTHKIIFALGDNIRIKRVILYSVKNNETLKDILTKNKTATVTYKKINPTKYIAHVKTDKPIFLIFSDSYHPLWKAYVDGNEYDSIIAYSFINSFYIPKAGEYNVIIEFTGQRYVWIGLAISITTFIFLISYIIFGGRIFKPFKQVGEKIWKKLKHS